MDSDPTPPSPDAWVASLKAVATNRDRSAFADLFGHFAPRVKSYMRQLGADDGRAEELAQEVMLTVWRRAELYEEREAAVSTWIFAIARNKRIDRLRREKRPEIDPNDPTLTTEAAPEGEARLSHAQSVQRLVAAMAALPDEQSQVLKKNFFEDKAHGVIAEELGLPLGTVKSRIRLALTKLRQELWEMEE